MSFIPSTWDAWRQSGVRIPLEPPPGARLSANAPVSPALPQPPADHLYPIRLARARPGLRVRDFLHELASVFWRTVHAEMRPCCLGYRYGHGWQHGWQEQVTRNGGWPAETLRVQPGHLLLGYREQRVNSMHGVYIDYVAIQQGPPAPCPTCGCRPPRARMERWRAHFARHQRRPR